MQRKTYLMAIFFATLVFSKKTQALTIPYCCCNDQQCIGGDHNSCCTTTEHPQAWGGLFKCAGVGMSGDWGKDPDPCGH